MTKHPHARARPDPGVARVDLYFGSGWNLQSGSTAREGLVLTGEMKTTEIVIAGKNDVEAMSGMPVEHAEARNLVFHRIDLMGASLGHEDIK